MAALSNTNRLPHQERQPGGEGPTRDTGTTARCEGMSWRKKNRAEKNLTPHPKESFIYVQYYWTYANIYRCCQG